MCQPQCAGKVGDTVESVKSNEVILVSKSFRYVERSVLDLTDDSIRVLEFRSKKSEINFDSESNQ